MRTLEKLLTYNFSDEDKIKLEILWIVNWCWAKWRFNFSNFVDKVENYIWFKSEKFDSFKKDVKEFCSFQHDVRFWEWWNIIDFFIANLEFINWMLNFLHWTSVKRRILVFIILFFWLTFLWFSAFNFWEKRSIREYLNKN